MGLTTGSRFGPYEILSAIGAGGMGEVYKARDTRLDRTVAVKVLPAELAAEPDRRARFEREARAIAGDWCHSFQHTAARKSRRRARADYRSRVRSPRTRSDTPNPM
jgi:serine/threonine protein kinase